jgi:hypothetical protein
MEIMMKLFSLLENIKVWLMPNGDLEKLTNNKILKSFKQNIKSLNKVIKKF